MLPPVEPPSARFIIQLFVVPALIVMLVVGVWIVVTWLVHRTTMKPEDLIDGLQTASVARWQRASELADLLRNERFAEFRNNGKAATQLAAVLDREVDAAGGGERMDEENVNLRYFLARALGEFQVDEGTDILLKTATADRDPQEALVRRGALQALAIRAFNLSQLDPPRTLADPNLEPTLFKLATDENPLVRSETAFVLGQMGTPTALAELEKVVGDPTPTPATTPRSPSPSMATWPRSPHSPRCSTRTRCRASAKNRASPPSSTNAPSSSPTPERGRQTPPGESRRRLHPGHRFAPKNHRRRPRRPRKGPLPPNDRPAGRGDAKTPRACRKANSIVQVNRELLPISNDS